MCGLVSTLVILKGCNPVIYSSMECSCCGILQMTMLEKKKKKGIFIGISPRMKLGGK